MEMKHSGTVWMGGHEKIWGKEKSKKKQKLKVGQWTTTSNETDFHNPLSKKRSANI